MQLKICGLREYNNIQQVVKTAHPDYAGFIFYDQSPRCVIEDDLEEIIRDMPQAVNKVGVFVDEESAVMESKAQKFHLDFLQLHGNESAGLCEALNAKGYRIIKAFSITPKFDFDLLQDYMPYVKYFLFDTKGEHQGGNGYTFDWEILNSYDQQIPFFLSGGISLENLDHVKDFLHLNIHALDVNSKFEVSPGIKEISKLKALSDFIEEYK